MTTGRVRTLAVMAVAAVLAATSNLVLRHGMGGMAAEADAWETLVGALTSPLVLGGLLGYGFSQLLWLNVLAEARLGAAFPVFVSATFVMVMTGAVVALGEPATAYRLGGALLVATGIVVAEWSRGDPLSGEPGRRSP